MEGNVKDADVFYEMFLYSADLSLYIIITFMILDIFASLSSEIRCVKHT
jgi:hypothetical protein